MGLDPDGKAGSTAGMNGLEESV